MAKQKDILDLMDELISDLAFMRTLAEAAIDKSHFYLANQSLLGPHRDFLIRQAKEIEDLLVLAEQFLDRSSENMEDVAGFLCHPESSGAAV